MYSAISTIRSTRIDRSVMLSLEMGVDPFENGVEPISRGRIVSFAEFALESIAVIQQAIRRADEDDPVGRRVVPDSRIEIGKNGEVDIVSLERRREGGGQGESSLADLVDRSVEFDSDVDITVWMRVAIYGGPEKHREADGLVPKNALDRVAIDSSGVGSATHNDTFPLRPQTCFGDPGTSVHGPTITGAFSQPETPYDLNNRTQLT